MEITKKNRRDYDKPARPRRDYDGKPSVKFDSKNGGEHRSAGYKSTSGGKSPFGAGRRSDSGHKPFNSEHKPYGSERKTSAADRKTSYPEREERRTFGSDRKPYGTEGKPYAGERKASGADRKPFAAGRKPAFAAKRKKTADAPQTEVRLNKFIANSGICSRREADRLIEAGAVSVNGVVVTELGTKVDIRKDTVLFGDQKLRGEEKVYIVMNKPKGFVTTTSDPHAEQTVMDLLTKCPTRVFPVGRLDKNTTGVLMFTNDGELSERLTHPSFNKKKIYEATLDKSLSADDFRTILSGVTLEDGPIAADELHYVDAEDHRKIGIEIHSGKNRIVRRIFESLGYQVKGLDRVYFAGLTKKGIKRGQWRYLSEGEVNILKMGAFS